MKGQTKEGLKTEERWDVYLTRGDRRYFSKRYKSLSAADNRVNKLKGTYGYLGYGVVIVPVEEIV